MPSAKRTLSQALSLRAVNRATLARQMLLDRAACPAADAIERLAGLQAQLARPPYVGLWTRVAGFERAHLTELALARRVARGTLFRGTLHLVTARDYVWMRPTIRPVLEGAMRSVLGERTARLDLQKVVRDARAVVEQRPRPFDEIRRRLVASNPGADERAMGYAVRCALPLVQIPEDGVPWGWGGKAAFGSAEAWLGRAIDGPEDVPGLVRRYLAAFGPATPADATAWSGLRGMKDVFAAMRDELVVLRDASGRELFDLPDAPRPGEDAGAPPRFLPDYDNLLLAHDDRTRVIPPEHRPRLASKNGQVPMTVLVDGRLAGAWRTEVKRGVATLTVIPWVRLTRGATAGLGDEGERLVRFVEPGARDWAVAFAEPA